MYEYAYKPRGHVPEELIRKLGWKPSIGWPLLICRHYREPPPGTGHAVCCDGICEIHNDRYNPMTHPMEHALIDAWDSTVPLIASLYRGWREYKETQSFASAGLMVLTTFPLYKGIATLIKILLKQLISRGSGV
ncbi:MAG: hypothetical protein F7C81_00155 [Desulfurococcales archaeon]|nr:hypothetical protein [Desulfurococcales archaeon]